MFKCSLTYATSCSCDLKPSHRSIPKAGGHSSESSCVHCNCSARNTHKVPPQTIRRPSWSCLSRRMLQCNSQKRNELCDFSYCCWGNPRLTHSRYCHKQSCSCTVSPKHLRSTVAHPAAALSGQPHNHLCTAAEGLLSLEVNGRGAGMNHWAGGTVTVCYLCWWRIHVVVVSGQGCPFFFALSLILPPGSNCLELWWRFCEPQRWGKAQACHCKEARHFQDQHFLREAGTLIWIPDAPLAFPNWAGMYHI